MSDFPNYPDMIIMPPGRYFLGDPRVVIKDESKWAALLSQSHNNHEFIGEIDGFKMAVFAVQPGIYTVHHVGDNYTAPVASGFISMVPTDLSDNVLALYDYGAVKFVSDKTGCFHDNTKGDIGVLRFSVSRDFLISEDPECYSKCCRVAVSVDLRKRRGL